jgi:sulfatase maturation enzyme AslB (radical SAM superfamily)
MYHTAELVHWMTNRDTKVLLPAQVDIDLTNICNQDCYYCNSADHRSAAPVQKKYTEYIELLDKLATWRAHSPNSYGTTHTITYPGGGEPTVLAGYEHVIEHTIDLGFLTSITTNGSKLDRLLNNVSVEKIQKMAWIGIDIDAGTEDLYEQIRRSLTSKSLFTRVKENARELIAAGAKVDFKCLINPYNDNQQAIDNLFDYVKEVQGRMMYFRPVIYNNQAHPITDELKSWIVSASQRTGIPYWINENKTQPRQYKRCHQMYHFPVFCAEGYIYVCCDNKGNPAFSIGRWDQGDFRDLWLSQKHHDIYNKTNVSLCKPCRPNGTNNDIQSIIDHPKRLEELYL